MHGLAVTGFVFLAGLVVFAATVSLGLSVPHCFVPLVYLAVLFPILQIAAVVIGIMKRLSYAVILPGSMLCAGLVVYLIHDDPQPPTLPDLGPVAAINSESYQTFVGW